MRPVALIIRDGWGIGEKKEYNAVKQANAPNMDYYLKNYPNSILQASGEYVGLPKGYQGSSEVGHLNMGAGRIVEQEITRINKSMDSGEFFKNKNLLKAYENCRENNSSLHLLGLVQDEGVHAHIDHLYRILEFSKEQKIKNVFVHFFSDGRDTPPQSAKRFVKRLEDKMKDLEIGKIATLIGRYYAMDRDNNWQRIKFAYRALALGDGLFAESAEKAIEMAYKRAEQQKAFNEKNPGKEMIIETDEYILPTIINAKQNSVARIKDKDSAIFFNFRQDRAIELTKAFIEDEFKEFEREKLDIVFVGLTKYYDGFENYVLPPMSEVGMKNLLGKIISKKGLKQLRIAETQKFKHVTSFFNGKVEKPYENEERKLVESSKVPEDRNPEMKAYEVTEELLKKINEDKYDFIVLNYANCDMVGHTGKLEPAIKAVEVVDACVGEIVNAVLKMDGVALVTSDHGNAEEMWDFKEDAPHTFHTKNSVEFIYISNDAENIKLRDGILADIAPTVLEILEIKKPKEMIGKSLIKK